ncbi:ECF transporter S component [Fusibacter sp. 3D3]|uniref:ECF transporter S component n=1 Tax=Fusibacter sp. 3D3 TaxID=1048380 RepID=UPI0008530B42|nr:ECF transporter S component [Fusibacter sp. 3D3]GAU78872.1 substrate-specific component PdxU2 of predicted pyridoxin-related ECF transporter [Fusibacter sp. 3D3]
MKKNFIQEMVLASMFIAIGLILPMIFHSFGLGSTFLPMHIPVLVAGFTLGLPYAVAVGMLTPLLSSLLTGMPPLFPVMPYMVFELGAYAAVGYYLGQKLNRNTYLALIGSMIAGRLVAGVAVWILVLFFGAKFPSPLVFVISAVTAGIPGIIIQLLFIPPIILLLKKANLIKNEVCHVK